MKMTTEEEYEWLKQAVKEIRSVIEIEVDNENYPELQEKINKLSVISATAASAQATAKKLKNIKERELIRRLPEDFGASMQAKWLDAECFEENGMLVYCERLSASVSHSIDGLRSILSFQKADMENSKHQTT